MIDDIIKQTSKLRYNQDRRNKKYYNKRPRTDETIKFCNGCNMVWERKDIYGKLKDEGDQIHRYNHIPTYGKIREQCPKCDHKDK